MSTNEAQLALALDDLAKQTTSNFSGTSKKHNVNRTTLRRRFQGIQRSRTEFHSESIQRLTNAQEQELIYFINKLIDRSIPPTSQNVRNVAEEIVGGIVGKN